MSNSKNKLKLTAKQEKFCNEYLVDLNASGAARRAGYSVKTSNVTGPQYLLKPVVQARIQQLRKVLAKNEGVTPEKVVAEFASIAFHKPSKIYKVSDKIKALESLGKYLGIFLEDNKQKADSFATALSEATKCRAQ